MTPNSAIVRTLPIADICSNGLPGIPGRRLRSCDWNMASLHTHSALLQLVAKHAGVDPASYDPARATILNPANGFVLSGDQYNGMIIPWRRLAGCRYRPHADRQYWRVRPPLQRRQAILADPQCMVSAFLGGPPRCSPTASTTNGLVHRTGPRRSGPCNRFPAQQ